MGPLGVVTDSIGYDQCVAASGWLLGVVSGWWLYFLPHNEATFLLSLYLLAASSILSVQFF